MIRSHAGRPWRCTSSSFPQAHQELITIQNKLLDKLRPDHFIAQWLPRQRGSTFWIRQCAMWTNFQELMRLLQELAWLQTTHRFGPRIEPGLPSSPPLDDGVSRALTDMVSTFLNTHETFVQQRNPMSGLEPSHSCLQLLAGNQSSAWTKRQHPGQQEQQLPCPDSPYLALNLNSSHDLFQCNPQSSPVCASHHKRHRPHEHIREAHIIIQHP